MEKTQRGGTQGDWREAHVGPRALSLELRQPRDDKKIPIWGAEEEQKEELAVPQSRGINADHHLLDPSLVDLA